jgi:hypothetical protein
MAADLLPPTTSRLRRRPPNLAPIETSIANAKLGSRWKPSRTAPPTVDAPDNATREVPLKTGIMPETKLEHKSSRMSLFNLFSRPKVEKARGHSEGPMPVYPHQSKTPAPSTQNTKSVVREPSISAVQRQPEASKPKSVKASAAKRSMNWDPPPLFQAYPQAIKYATLQSSVVSAEAIVRAQQQHRRPYSILQESKSRLDLSEAAEGETEVKRERTRLSSKRLSSASFQLTPDTNKKIYVLVTAGYVLQYSANGPFDRLPEKVLPLGSESAAFASDLIPGKHWVLQISQTANEDGTVTAAQSRSLLSKLRLQNSNARRHASNFLLVLESAEEMDAWLTAVRKEIESLGGMKCKSEPEAKPATTGNAPESQLKHRPSHRYLVQRDPNFDSNRMSKSFLALSPTDSPQVPPPEWSKDNLSAQTQDSDSHSSKSSLRMSKRFSFEASSATSTHASNDQSSVATVRESSRLSIVSTATSGSGTFTLATSRETTPPDSPKSDNPQKPVSEQTRNPSAMRPLHLNSTSGLAYRRKSMQVLPPTDENSVTSLGNSHGAMDESADSTEQLLLQFAMPPSVNRSRSPAARPNISPEKKRGPTYRSSSVPAPRIPLPPIPTQDRQVSRSRPQSTIGSLSPNLQFGSYSARSSPSPISPIAEDQTEEHGPHTKYPLPEAVLTDISNKPARLSQMFEQKPPPNFSLPSLPKAEEGAPRAARRVSSVGGIPTVNVHAPNSDHTSNSRAGLRPLTVKGSELRVPKRQSSLLPPPLPLAISISGPNAPSKRMSQQQQQQQQPPQQQGQQARTLKRPTSMQIRSDPAPFLASARPGGRSASAAGMASTTSVMTTSRPVPSASKRMSYDILAPPPYAALKVQRSMPSITLPPVGPPPNMPLPSLPPVSTNSRQISV